MTMTNKKENKKTQVDFEKEREFILDSFDGYENVLEEIWSSNSDQEDSSNLDKK